METPPPAARPSRPPLTYRKLFRWGLVFWVLVWLASVCTVHSIYVQMKGGGVGVVLIGNGALSVTPSEDFRMSWPLSARWQNPEGIWYPESLALIRKYPETLFLELGMRGWQMVSERTNSKPFRTISIPFVGFLFIWLAAGLFGEIRLLRHSAKLPERLPVVSKGSKKQVAVIGGAILGLAVLDCYVNHKASEVDMAFRCADQIRALGWRAMGKKVGEPLSWVPDPGSLPLLKNCPAGGTYLLSPVKPPKGTPAAQCQREDHRRCFAGSEAYFRIQSAK